MWQDEDDSDVATKRIPDDIVDVSFRLSGKTLPVEHAHSLATQLIALAPWIKDAEAGIQLVIAGEEGNGWFREQNRDEVIYIARRTRLTLRVPKSQIDAIAVLKNTRINLDGHILEIGEFDTRLLSDQTTIYARHVASTEMDEDAFMDSFKRVLAQHEIKCRKILCGKSRTVWTPDGDILTRSVMLAELRREDAIKIQQVGIGPHRLLGCGFFVPHKSI